MIFSVRSWVNFCLLLKIFVRIRVNSWFSKEPKNFFLVNFCSFCSLLKIIRENSC